MSDQTGDHRVKIEYTGNTSPPRPITPTAKAVVQDMNAQAQETSTNILIHPSQLYVGFKLQNSYGKVDKEQFLNVVVCDIDGKLIANIPVQLEFTLKGKRETRDENVITTYV